MKLPEAAPSEEAEAARRRIARLRVALVHDWLLGMRGGERVLTAMVSLFPRAEIHTLFHDPARLDPVLNRRPVHPSPLSRLPGVRRYYRYLLPLLPWAASRVRLGNGVDLVIASSHCVAHGVPAPPGAAHLTYCHSPMRYLYDQAGAYAAGGGGLAARALALMAPRLRRWDAAAARRCGRYVANSAFVAGRIRRAYGLEAQVIHPPVRTEFFRPAEAGEARGPRADRPWLVVSALAPYKRVDRALEAAGQLGRQLRVVGRGQAERELRRRAGPTVEFLGQVGDAELRRLYQTSAGLIFPGEEDFGIVPLEAMACGLPVLALRAGGLIETHREGVTGAFFEAPAAASLAEAWAAFDPDAYDPAAIRRHAETFSTERFLDRFALCVDRFVHGCE